MRDDYRVPAELPVFVRPTWRLFLRGFKYRQIARILRKSAFEIRLYMAVIRHLFPYWTKRLFRKNECRSKQFTRASKMSKLEYLNELRRRDDKPLLQAWQLVRRDGRLFLKRPTEFSRWP